VEGGGAARALNRRRAAAPRRYSTLPSVLRRYGAREIFFRPERVKNIAAGIPMIRTVTGTT
jgi:hypothetical protein